MASVLEIEVDAALKKLDTLAKDEGALLPQPLPRLRDLDTIVTRVLVKERGAQAAPGGVCKPWDYAAFLERARSFKAVKWFAKPEAYSPLRVARFGWRCVARDTIVCDTCGARVTVGADAGDAAKELEDGHTAICPWRGDPSPESFLGFQYLSDAECVRQLRERLSGFASLDASAHEDIKVDAVPASLVALVKGHYEAAAEGGGPAPVADRCFGEANGSGDETPGTPAAAHLDGKSDEEVVAVYGDAVHGLAGGSGGAGGATAAVFAAFGWRPATAAVFATFGWRPKAEGDAEVGSPGAAGVAFSVECALCGAVARMRHRGADAVPGKRRKFATVHPERAHRVWCPIIRDYLASEAGWKRYAKAALRAPDPNPKPKPTANSKTKSPSSKLAETYQKIRSMLDDT